ncbi:MAG: efflux RND transporter periplasmic adaptor subunit [Thermoanaerobaculales bacterium]|jgi:RND family efflux transporter MFP subunit|nr:efflux RND transporter periplasmic adaptor subunit [Thermoanaerobaculales bacterium]
MTAKFNRLRRDGGGRDVRRDNIHPSRTRSRTTEPRRSRQSGTTSTGVFLGLVAGIALSAFSLLDPLNLHGLDERLRGQAAADSGTAAETGLWTCGMHPNVISEEPGTCPICHMDLVPLDIDPDGADTPPADSGWTCPVHDVIDEASSGECPICGRELVSGPGSDAHAGHGGAGSAPASPEVYLAPSVIQSMNVTTAAAERRDLIRRVVTVGSLDYDEALMVSVTPRFSGFVERVYVNTLGQPVRRGDPLFEIDSPELVQTQRELLAAVRYAARLGGASPEVRDRARALLESSRRRLDTWEISPERVAEIESTGEVQRTVTVSAPADGVVMQRLHGLKGMAVEPGMDLLHIADLSTLQLRVELYEHQLGLVGVGDPAEVSFDALPDADFSGRVRYIEPAVAPETRTVGLILEVPNPDGRLRVGLFAEVSFSVTAARDALVVPSQAVIRTGDRDLVVIALGEGRFAPRQVTLGAESDGLVEVAAGLADGDRIATSAQFLIDSESNLRAAVSSLLAARSAHEH